MSAPRLLHMTAPLREDFDVPYHDIGPATEAPAVALVAGIHGNELNGIFVLARLASFLRQVAAGERSDVQLRRRVILVPAVNVLGVNTRRRRWPFDGTDINRMFPGYDGGETTQRIAAALLKVTADARFRVDIHSSNLDFEELPQVRLYDATDEERRCARWLGLPAVIERPSNPTFTSTLAHAWRRLGGVNLIVQAGLAGALQTAHCESLFRGFVAFLGRAGVLAGVALAESDEEVHHFGPRHSLPVISEHAGWFVSRMDVGHWVQAGDVLGFVYDGFDGMLRAEIRTPVAGLLSGLRRQPLLFEGDLLARIQTSVEVAEVTDTYLQGQGQ
jgi:predicted deacylase